MDYIKTYIKPDLLVLVPVLYFLGSCFKKSDLVEDKYIPLTLTLVGVVLSTIYVLGTEPFSLAGIWTAIVQGMLVAAGAVYGNQILKQAGE